MTLASKTLESPQESRQAPLWQREMQTAFRNLPSLLGYLGLDPDSASGRFRDDPAFPLLVPRSFAERMRPGNWHDPLLMQVLPQSRERISAPGFAADAVGDLASQVLPGLLHKYASRALIMISPQCAIHCRYCFRREFPYADLPKDPGHWDKAWAHIAADADLDEIIFSGGDPLFLDTRKLTRLMESACAIPSIKTLRLHTRLPIVLPSRVDAALLAAFAEAAKRKTLIVVVHANHPQEIDEACLAALKDLKNAGALVLNQSVLLAGINDDAQILAGLSRRLMLAGCLPYYLHQLDRVRGTAHFEVPSERGLEIVTEMRRMLPGYAVPRYVREIAGEAYKTPIEVPDRLDRFKSGSPP